MQYIGVWLGCDSLCIVWTFEAVSPLRIPEEKIHRHHREGVWLGVKLISVKDAGSYWFNSVQVFFPIWVQFEDLSTCQFLKHSSSEDVITQPFLTRFDSDMTGRQIQWGASLRKALIGSLIERVVESITLTQQTDSQMNCWICFVVINSTEWFIYSFIFLWHKL